MVDRIERLNPDWIHGMHGGSLPRETIPSFVCALREEPFAYPRKLLGRELPGGRNATVLISFFSFSVHCTQR